MPARNYLAVLSVLAVIFYTFSVYFYTGHIGVKNTESDFKEQDRIYEGSNENHCMQLHTRTTSMAQRKD